MLEPTYGRKQGEENVTSLRTQILTKLPVTIVLGTIAYILTMLILSYLIDYQGLDPWGLKTWIEQTRSTYPLFWIYAFTEASPTENVQWSMLAACIILCTVYIVMNKKAQIPVSWGWKFLLFGLVWMIIEDFYNIRHKTVDFIRDSFDVSPGLRIGFVSMRGLVEITLYAILGAIMIVALAFILKEASASWTGKKYLVTGYAFYFVASFCSATRGIGNWYTRLGNAILDHLSVDWAERVTHHIFRGRVGFYFVDFVFEEPLELLGAAFIAAALVAFIAHHCLLVPAEEDYSPVAKP